MVRPLLELGAKEEVLHAAGCNIGSFIWSGSLTSYYALFLELLEGLYSHPTSQVHRWAKYMCRQLEDRREAAKFEDEERMAYGEI